MKNWIYIVIVSLLPMVSACSDDDDFIFSEDAQLRLEKFHKETQTALRSSSNGWKMLYYPLENSYGAYHFIFKFKEKNRVEMAAEFEPIVGEYSYDLNLSQGVVLTFDSYSPLHVLSDPLFIGEDRSRKGFGLEGDFEFAIQKVTPDTIYMIGKKRYQIHHLIKATASDWEDMETYGRLAVDYKLEEKDNLKLKMSSSGVAGASAKINELGHLFMCSYSYEGESYSVRVPYRITLEELKFENPVTVMGVSFDGLNIEKVGDNRTFWSNDGAKSLEFVIDEPLNLSPGQIPTYIPDPSVNSAENFFAERVDFRVTMMSDDLKALEQAAYNDEPDFGGFFVHPKRSSYMGSFKIAGLDSDGVVKQYYYNFSDYELLNGTTYQLRFLGRGGSRQSGFADYTKYTNNNNVKAVVDIFFDTEGMTLIEDAKDSVYWFRSIKNPNTWMKVER